ncbi:mitochondrial 18 KDa protein-domain-containing protein [Poronia punctata]|nr:mitochondrial 18 KDa protein-domain-containing protein [Poronia punctata]
MFWSKGPDKKSEERASGAPPVDPTKDATNFDPNKLPERQKLPKKLQKIIEESDKDESFFDERATSAPDSTESNVRYAAYANRLRTIMLSAHRYVAYTSDIGESFRPVAHPWLVRSAYGISWAYILGDVSYEGYKAYWTNQRTLNPQLELSEKQQKMTGLTLPPAPADTKPGFVSPLDDYRTVMVQRGLFQSLASMGLPAFTIHSVVRYSGRALKDVKNKTIRVWGPIGLGLAVVPFLPRLFDEPVENAVEWVFHKGFASYGGRDYVGDSPATGREAALKHQTKTHKEKEL